jgi:uncharacterized protein YbbK (DUF523 family)
MDRILISACLIGRPVRYNGTSKSSDAKDILARWQDEGRLVPLCPEIAVGFQTPRPPAEIRTSDIPTDPLVDGVSVLRGQARVFESGGRDVSDLYITAAHETVTRAQRAGCRYAVLTDGSPSCGSTFIYDGTFSGRTQSGVGTTTAALRDVGISVWPETAIPELDRVLRSPGTTRDLSDVTP